MRFAVLVSIVFAAIVAAAPTKGGEHGHGGTVNACEGGTTYCCDNWNQAVDKDTGDLLAVPIDVMANLNCDPISVLAIVLQTQCASSTVCCQDMETNGLINAQCIGLAI